MELVYLWVEDYKNIQGEGFDFSPRFRCEYDEVTKVLEIVDKEETGESYLKNFFDGNINVTAIVGENGSGKSSILKSIFDFKTNNELKDKKRSHLNLLFKQNSFPLNQDSSLEGLINIDIFLVYFDRSKKEYFYYRNNNFLILKINGKEISNNRIKTIHDFKGFYLNNARDILITNNKQNPSLTLLEQILQLLMKYDNFYTFYNKEYIFTKMTIKINRDKLFKKEFENNEYKDFLNALREKILSIIEEKMPHREYSGAVEKFKKEYYLEYKSSRNFISDLELAFITSFFNNLVNLFSNSENIKREFIKNNENYFNDLNIDNMIEKFIDFNKEINHHNLHYGQNKNLIKSYEELLNFFKINKIENFSKFVAEKNINGIEHFILEFDVQKDIKILKEILKQILNLSQTNENDLMNMFLIDFKNFDGKISYKQLSDGEKAIFELFTKILYRVIFLDEKTLFLDEPEIFLHPHWSKELIHLLIKLLNNFELKDCNIIITTHSPFILSDLPKENIIFLEKGKQVYPFENGQTFGANIHTLLSHGFFMKNGLMGEFAKDKIDTAIKYLNQTKLSEKELEYCENIISIIGEPIIKRQLQKMLDSKRLKKIDEIDKIYDEIEFLKHRLDILRKNQ